jgi:hypothetical protein
MPAPPAGFYAFVALGSAVMSVAALVYFMIDAMVSSHLAGEQRALWVVALLLGNATAFPVYWYVAWWRPRRR